MITSRKQTLCFGDVAELFYSYKNLKKPRQLDLIDQWLPGILVFPRANPKHEEPEYKESKYVVFADYNNDCSFYSGGTSNRVTQIVGRLIGTAKSNQEKGRKDAELIRKHIAKLLVTDFRYIEKLQNNTKEMLDKIPEDRIQDFHYEIFNYMCDIVDSRNAMSEEEKVDEPFPFDDYIFDDLIYNIAYQLHLFSYEGMINAYLWLLLGGFLRNHIGLLTKMYHSGFIAINRQLSEFETLSDKINYLFNPDEYYSTYNGDDFDSNYPDTTWKCDKCGAILNQQKGFDDKLSEWICKDCGHTNKIDISEVFNNEEDYLNDKPIDKKDYERAIQTRKKETETNNNEKNTNDLLMSIITKLENDLHRRVVKYAETNDGYAFVIEGFGSEHGINQCFQDRVFLSDRRGNIKIAHITYPLETLDFIDRPMPEITKDDLINI